MKKLLKNPFFLILLGALIISIVSWLLSRFVADRRSGVTVRQLRP